MLRKQVKTKLEVIDMNFCVINFNFKLHQSNTLQKKM